MTGSFLYWGAPTLYSVPALLAGLVQNFTGIPNQFVGIGAWTGAGGIPLGGNTAGPASLLTGVPEGFAYLAQGLLGYVNPGTYIGPDGISLSNSLLRTYAWGSLPGADILRRLIGLDPNPAPVSTQANSQSGIGTTGSTASGIESPLGSLLGSFRGLGAFTGSPVQQPAAPAATSVNSDRTAIDKVITPDISEQLGPQNGNSGATAPSNVNPPVQSNFQQNIQKAVDNITSGGPKLNLQKLNPLDRGNANDSGTTGNHEPGAGKTPVRDLIKKVTGGLTGQKDTAGSAGSTGSTGSNNGSTN